MRAIILAAGRGSRMGALTEEKPKGLTVIKGKPLIEHQIEAISKAGIHEIAIVTGYKSKFFESYSTHHFHNPKWSETNMVYSLDCAKEWLLEDDCIISYSDIFYTPEIIKSLISSEEKISVAYDPKWKELWLKRFENPLDDAETFRIDEQDYILEIGKKPSSIDEVKGQYMGLLKFKRGSWGHLVNGASLNKIDMTSFLSSLILRGIKIKAIPNHEPWCEYDQPEDLEVKISELT